MGATAIEASDSAPMPMAAQGAGAGSSRRSEKAYRNNDFGAPPPPPMQAPIDPAPAPAEEPPEAKGPRDVSAKQYLVYTATFNMAVYQVEIGLDRTEALAKELGGYLSSRGDNEITIRVPRDKFNVALDRIAQLGEVIHRDVKALDVTDEYVDTESRLRNARVMRDRLQALLQKAAVKEALEIEKELARVTQELELLEGKMKALKDRITFSTITVRFEPRVSSGVESRTKLPFPWIHQLGLPTLLTLEEAK